MATKIRPIVFKITEPEPIWTMDSSNVTSMSNGVAYAQGPNYPDGFLGTGRTAKLIIKEDLPNQQGALRLYYASDPQYGVQTECGQFNCPTGPGTFPAGEYTCTLTRYGHMDDTYGKYMGFGLSYTITMDSALMSKVEIKIY